MATEKFDDGRCGMTYVEAISMMRKWKVYTLVGPKN